jgi:hypothetical protein
MNKCQKTLTLILILASSINSYGKTYGDDDDGNTTTVPHVLLVLASAPAPTATGVSVGTQSSDDRRVATALAQAEQLAELRQKLAEQELVIKRAGATRKTVADRTRLDRLKMTVRYRVSKIRSGKEKKQLKLDTAIARSKAGEIQARLEAEQQALGTARSERNKVIAAAAVVTDGAAKIRAQLVEQRQLNMELGSVAREQSARALRYGKETSKANKNLRLAESNLQAKKARILELRQALAQESRTAFKQAEKAAESASQLEAVRQDIRIKKQALVQAGYGLGVNDGIQLCRKTNDDERLAWTQYGATIASSGSRAHGSKKPELTAKQKLKLALQKAHNKRNCDGPKVVYKK